MPEGHTIHRIAASHSELFAGAPVRVSSPQGRFAAGAAQLDGRRLDEVEAYGKHLLYHWSGRRTLHVHLGLVGVFPTHPEPDLTPPPAARLVLTNARAAAHLLGPMTCALIDRCAAASIVERLGPDPLRKGARRDGFLRRVASDRRPIGAVLLDQAVVAGIGNVYRAEVLFLCGISPATPAAELAEAQAAELWATAKAQLRRGLADGRIVTVDPRDVGAGRRIELPDALRLYVYQREHRPCLRCRTPIRGAEIGGRRVWWCPSCQA